MTLAIRFRVRTLLLLLAILCCVLAYHCNRCRQQQESVEQILAIGGIVTYEEDATKHLLSFLGRDFVADVESVEFPKNATDEDLKLIRKLRGLKSVDLAYCYGISDEGIKQLRSASQLEELILNGNSERTNFVPMGKTAGIAITDDSLRHISQITTLKRLELWNNHFSDEGVEVLKKLTSLEYLGISSRHLTRPKIAELQRCMPNCYIEASTSADYVSE